MGKSVTRVNDLYINPLMQGAAAPIASMGSTSLIIGNLPVVQAIHPLLPIPDTMIPGPVTVLHNGLPLQTMGDSTIQGGSLLSGDFTVLIG